MAHAAGDALDFPIYGAHFRLTFPILDNDGDLIASAAALDSEVSKDSGTFADCTNEATQIATTSGVYYLDLTGAEMEAKVVAVVVKSTTTDSKDTVLVLHPKRLPVLENGTAQAGAAGTITLASGSSAQDDYYNGMFVHVTNNSPAGVDNQARRIIDYVGSTKVATVESNWGTNPSSATTYDILVPDYSAVSGWAGDPLPDPDSDGYPVVTIKDGTGQGELNVTSGVVDANAVQISGDANAADLMEAFFEGAVISSSVNDAGPTATDFDAAAGLSATDDFYNGLVVVFTSGTLQGVGRRVIDYTGSTRNFNFAGNVFPAAPANSDTFVIVGRIE